MTKKRDHAYADRVNRNHAWLVTKLLAYLDTHVVEVVNKVDKTFSHPEPIHYYEMMFHAYYCDNIAGDENYQPFTNREEHLRDVIGFLQFTDDELEVRLVEGKVSLPTTFHEYIKLPHTFYTEDEIIFKRYG